ncbi:MAG TPA: aminotransferase class V-fold PLP-dependent enzyme [Gaiellaceae bacterium]
MAVQTQTTADRCRHRFPIFERLVYINSCSQGALSDHVRASYDRFLDDWHTHGSPWDIWGGLVEDGRAAFGRLINAEPPSVAVTPSVSVAVSSLASGLDFEQRPNVVISDFEFPTVGQIWHAQERRGASVRVVPADGNRIPLERFDEAIDERTGIVSITAVCYRNGARNDVEEIVRIAHERGAHVLLDAYQAIGTYPIDVQALDVDFLVAGTLKYLLGSSGLGFLYCRPSLTELIQPTVTGWLADSDIGAMDHTRYSPSPTATRFEGGAPAVPSVYAAIAGIELVEEIGIADTRAHVASLTETLIDGVTELGGDVATPRELERRGALVCVPSTDAPGLVSALAAKGIVTSTRDGQLRVSPHAYNNDEDITTLLAALELHRDLLARP